MHRGAGRQPWQVRPFRSHGVRTDKGSFVVLLAPAKPASSSNQLFGASVPVLARLQLHGVGFVVSSFTQLLRAGVRKGATTFCRWRPHSSWMEGKLRRERSSMYSSSWEGDRDKVEFSEGGRRERRRRRNVKMKMGKEQG